MDIKHLTLQKTLALAILLTGVIGIALVFFTDYTYRKLSYEQQKKSISQLIAIKSADLISELSEYQKDIGFRLQSEIEFKNALDAQNKEDVIYWLDQEFSRYYVTTGLVKLEKIIVYDTDFQLIATSDRGLDVINNKLPCYQVIDQVRALPYIERVKPISQLCEYSDRSLFSSIVSIGSLKPKGYIHVITSPQHVLTNIEATLGIPLRLYDKYHKLLHQSVNWPIKKAIPNTLISTYTLLDGNNKPFIYISAAADITVFTTQLNNTRYNVIFGATALTLFTIIIALIILRRGLSPLNNLRRAADIVTHDKFTSVNEEGYSEISAPIHAFNLMVEKTQSLIDDLKHEVIKHKNTEDKFKQEKEKAEQHARYSKKQSNFLHMTLQSIVDGVITTDVDGYIQTINPMAEQLTGWNEDEAQGQLLTQVIHAIKEDTRKRIDDLTENIEHSSVLDEPISAIFIQQHNNIETPVKYIAAPMRDHDDEIAGIVIIIHDESVQRSLNRQLTFQATHDALTGLINRYEFERRLKIVLSSRAEDQSINTLCYIDLDQFKLVNDTCGHAAGDELLKQITLLLENSLQGVGTLARLGGDEFGLLLKNHDITKTKKIVGTLLNVIQQFHFTWKDNTFTIGASIGIATIPQTTISCEQMLSNADSACYLAKESGRNRIKIFTEEDDKLLTQQREMHWISRINHALEEDRFQLYFQEIMPLKGHTKSFILHGEILLRMIDKEGDIVPPNNFLPAAERYNMITLIDRWVINKSIEWLATCKDKVLISVNISGISLSNKDFLNFIVSKIKQHKINPELLCFEITETAAISNLSIAIHFMNVLKKLGCSFALDDFGCGLSSFSYLTSLPVDYLKIDGTFVMDIDKDPMHYAMVKSINEVGQVMGIKTIAEFAASDEIIRTLREVGVDNAQGYAVARPIPLTSLSTRDTKTVLTAVKAIE